MLVIRDLEQLREKIAECNRILHAQSDDAMRAMFGTFKFDFSAELPRDPFDPVYRDFQMHLYERISGRSYSLDNERTLFSIEAYEDRPFPYYLQSPQTAGNHLLAVAFLLRNMALQPGARVLEFGPGWGNTTLALARLGMDVTAVDIEPNFCEVIRRRAARCNLKINVIEGNFFWCESSQEQFDAVVFFESFHHCDDHIRLLRSLHRALKPGGRIYFASEPIIEGYDVPWGVRTDGESLWAMHNFGWLELGFRETYFYAALARTGWQAERRTSRDLTWGSIWIARQVTPDEAAVEPCEPAAADLVTLSPASPRPPTDAPMIADPPADQVNLLLQRELDAIYRSTSWRVTAPLRAIRRMLPGSRIERG